jgi:hypothetical protein
MSHAKEESTEHRGDAIAHLGSDESKAEGN